MKYYKKNGSMFLENGKSKLRVQHVQTISDPVNDGRIVKVLSVQEVCRSTGTNPIAVGNALTLSFSPDRSNADSYEWKKGEPTQVPMQLK